MKSKIFILPFILMLPRLSYSQEKRIQIEIIKNDKYYCKHHISKQNQSNYKFIIKSSKVIIPALFEALEQQDPFFFSGIDSFNIVQGYNGNSCWQFGIVWKNIDSAYYYDYFSSKIEKLPFDLLDLTTQNIIKNFASKNSTFFSHVDADMHTRCDGSYFIATKYSSKNKIETWAFYE